MRVDSRSRVAPSFTLKSSLYRLAVLLSCYCRRVVLLPNVVRWLSVGIELEIVLLRACLH